jgi:hypothetical protein
MSKPLIVDTCSIINLVDLEVGNDTLVDILDKYFDVFVSSEIVSELHRHRLELGMSRNKILKFVRKARRQFHGQDVYEDTLFHAFTNGSGNSQKNRGERLNYALALYHGRKLLISQAIMLTDDARLKRGLGAWFDKRFKVIRIWTSLDFILHVYFIYNRRWQKSAAREALRTVNALMGGKQAEAAQRIIDYRKMLDEVDSLLARLPGVRGVQ